MEQFNLDKWLQDKSRKVVTRQGNPVRIICTDRKHTQSWPIVALESYDNGEFVLYANDKGRTDLANENIHDLFFTDEEKIKLPLTKQLEEYFKKTPKEQIEKDWKEIQEWYNQHYTDKSNKEEELTEFEKVLKEIIEDVQNGDYIEEESFDFWKDRLLDLARKELRKELVDIEKACEWIEEQTRFGIHPQGAKGFVEQFRKAMED